MKLRILFGLAFSCFALAVSSTVTNIDAAETGQQTIKAAAKQNQFSFVMFYRGNDAKTRQMYHTVRTTLKSRSDAVAIPVNVADKANRDIVSRYDASRIPLPAVIAVAPNGAICSVFPRKITPSQIEASFISPGQATCLKALQSNQIVLLCVHPDKRSTIPPAVEVFREDPLYRERTSVVSVRSDDVAESKFFKQLRIPSDRTSTSIAFMAPPGSMLGVFDQTVSFETLAETLSAAGKCCDDENCKHNKSAAKQGNARR